MKTKILKFDWLIISIVAFSYYAFLCAKEWSWMFVSGDSGDWLTASTWWMVPQPYGSPLYIVLGHLMNSLPINLVTSMTIGLSVIPASITVAITYLIVKRLFNSKLALISSLVLLSSAIFLTQSTILEEYALATMFLTLAVYFYVLDKKRLVLLMLGCGSAVHIIIVAISVIWLIVHFSEIKLWYKHFWIYILVGLVPYSLILLLMYLPTPRFIAGDLSFQSINGYLGSSGTIGSLSIYEAPKRLLQFGQVMLVSLGLGIVPLIVAFKKPWSNLIRLFIITVVFIMWLYVTDIDPSTWTFLCFGIPIMCILIAYGLSKMTYFNSEMVTSIALVLLLFNSIFLNADILTKQYSQAEDFRQAVGQLPDRSCIVESSGGQYGLGTLYIMSTGKDIIPLYYTPIYHPDESLETDAKYKSYLKYIDETYDIQGQNIIEQVRDAQKDGRKVYMLNKMLRPEWKNTFNLEELDSQFFSKVESVNDILPKYAGLNK